MIGVPSNVEKKPEKVNTNNAGIDNNKKCPVVIAKASKSDKYFLIIFTLKAYPTEAIITNKAYQ